VTIPIMVYNNQYVNQVDIPVETLLQLCEFENIKAVKDCTPSLEKMERLVRLVDGDVEIINGRGELNEPYGYLMGTKGYVSIVANFCPELSVNLHHLALEKKYREFMGIKNDRIMPILDFVSTLPPSQEAATVKAVEKLLGLNNVDCLRAPFLPLGQDENSKLLTILQKTGFIGSS
jgi:4-hydroxy-tetrahydrodipicolinate synthase